MAVVVYPTKYVETQEQTDGYFSAKLIFNLTDEVTATSTLLAEHLTIAEGVVDSYLTRRFVLPLKDPLDVLVYFAALRGCVFAFTHESLEMRKQALNEDTQLRAQGCRDWLELVAKGEAAIGDETGLTFNTTPPKRSMTFEDRYFTDGKEVDGEDNTTSNVGIESDFSGTGVSRLS